MRIYILILAMVFTWGVYAQINMVPDINLVNSNTTTSNDTVKLRIESLSIESMAVKLTESKTVESMTVKLTESKIVESLAIESIPPIVPVSATQTIGKVQILPAQYSKNLVQELMVIKIDRTNLTTEDPVLVYDNENVLCLKEFVLDKLSQTKQNLNYFLYNNPEDNNQYYCFIDSQVKFDRANGAATLVLPVNQLSTNKVNLAVVPNQPVYSQEAIYSNGLTYQLTQNTFSSTGSNVQNSLGGNFANTLTMPIGSLVNIFAAGASTGGNNLDRNATYFQQDFPNSMTSLVLGDNNAASGLGWGGSASIAGLQYGSNINLRPQVNFQAQNPELQGTLDNPAVLEFSTQNGIIGSPVPLNAGPYDITNIQTPNGLGNLLVNFKDSSGNIYQTLTIPYYNNANLLSSGTYLYQYNIGLPNVVSTGINTNYNTQNPLFSTNHQYAFNNSYTLHLHGEAQQGLFANLGVNNQVNLFNQAFGGFTTAFSQNASGPGSLLGIQLSRQPNDPNLPGINYNVSYSSPQFSTLSIPNGVGYESWMQSVGTYINFNSGLGLNFGYAQSVSNSPTNAFNGGVTYQYKRFVTQVTANQLYSQMGGMLTLGLNLSYTFNNSAISSNTQSQNGQMNINNSYQMYDPNNIWTANVGNTYTTDSQNPNTVQAGGSYNFTNIVATTSNSYTNPTTYNSTNTLGGSIILAGNGISLGRSSIGSFAIVDVGDLPNIGILQGDTYIGSTDINGQFIVPNLPAYYPQVIKIRQSDLPLNTELDTYSQTVIPPLNGGTRVVFKVVHNVPATLTITYGSKLYPPVGYSADLVNDSSGKVVDSLIIADDGLVVINKFDKEQTYTLKVNLREGDLSCHVSKANINATTSNQYMFNLENVKCSLEKRK